ncbi:hypothetical protein [Mycoplasmopsis iners]|uniref:hypothetical protein n=1 Tax=Mycoplasmopsis iners TaxID=76630 RepID=UPI000494EAFF|nr:hypothetical protein [Mycoplasmopsis iners]
MNDLNLQDLQSAHYKESHKERQRAIEKEKRRIKVMFNKISSVYELINRAKNILNNKIIKLLIIITIALLILGASLCGIMASSGQLFPKGILISSIVFIPMMIMLIIIPILINNFEKNAYSCLSQLIDYLTQLLNTLNNYQFADDENIQLVINNIKDLITPTLVNGKNKFRIYKNKNYILNSLVTLQEKVETMENRVKADYSEIEE